MNKNISIGIIGGTGLMGQLFVRFFQRHGYTVQVTGLNTEFSNIECAGANDVVIISVPINKTCDVIREISPYMKKEGLLMDFTSIKQKPLQLMLQSSQSAVLGVHPLFGPGLITLAHQKVVVCPGRGRLWQRWFVELLQKEDVSVKITDAKDHDKMMGVIQAMIHFATITIGHTLKELDLDVKETLDYSSPVYRLRLDMIGRILNQSPGLYGDIEMENPEAGPVLKKFMDSCKQLFQIIETKDREKFEQYFNEAADFFGDYKKNAQEESDYIIRTMAEREKK